jgi:hypothetical protein
VPVRAWRRSWQGGVVAVACLVVGLVRVVAVPPFGVDDGLTWASFALAISYGFAAVVARPAGSPSLGVLSNVLTKDRVGATLAMAAAVVGLVLVFGDQEHRADRHPAAPPPPGQGEPAPSSPEPATGP